MSATRKGEKWTKKEDKILTRLFKECCSYKQMGKELNRSWFACKCRLARLGLIKDEFEIPKKGIIYVNAPYEIPNKGEGVTVKFEGVFQDLADEVFPDEEDTSRTFSNAELNIVIDYLKSRLAQIRVMKVDRATECFVRQLEVAQVESVFEDEIAKVRNVQNMSILDRECVLKRF